MYCICSPEAETSHFYSECAKGNVKIKAGLGILYCIKPCNRVLFPVFAGPVLYSCMKFNDIENPVKQEIQEIIQGFLSQAKFPACL